MGSEAQIPYRLSPPLGGSSTTSNSAIGGMSALSFSVKVAANSSTVAAASFMMVDAASALAPDGMTYPDDTSGRSMS